MSITTSATTRSLAGRDTGGVASHSLAGPWRVATGVAALLAVALLLPASAAADRGGVNDPRGDSSGSTNGSWTAEDADIVQIKHGHRNGKLVHVVKVAGDAPHPEPRDDEPRPPSLALNTAPGHPGESCSRLGVDYRGAEYLITSISRGEPVLMNCVNGGSQRVQSRKAGESKFVYGFKERQIGNPARYGWRAETDGLDVAPDNSPWLPHKLRRAGGGNDRWRDCGDLVESGAGVYNVEAKRTGCRPARKVAQHWWDEGWKTPNKKWRGWGCRSKRTGHETGRARCVKRQPGKNKVVRFQYGA